MFPLRAGRVGQHGDHCSRTENYSIVAEQLSDTEAHCYSTDSLTTGGGTVDRIRETRRRGRVAAGLSAMEAEFREIDENGSWSAIYQVGPLDKSRWKRGCGRSCHV